MRLESQRAHECGWPFGTTENSMRDLKKQTSNSMKKLVCPSTSGTSSVWHHANASRTAGSPRGSAMTSRGIAKTPASAPPIRKVVFRASQAAPRLSPALRGSTFTSAPLSTSACADKLRLSRLRIRSSNGLSFVEYGKRMASSRVCGIKFAHQRVRRPRLEHGGREHIGSLVLQGRDARIHIYILCQDADKPQLVGGAQVPDAWKNFVESAHGLTLSVASRADKRDVRPAPIPPGRLGARMSHDGEHAPVFGHPLS